MTLLIPQRPHVVTIFFCSVCICPTIHTPPLNFEFSCGWRLELLVFFWRLQQNLRRRREDQIKVPCLYYHSIKYITPPAIIYGFKSGLVQIQHLLAVGIPVLETLLKLRIATPMVYVFIFPTSLTNSEYLISIITLKWSTAVGVLGLTTEPAAKAA